EHIPLQYLTGSQEFMGMEFQVTRDVLIPRQDTERLVEEVLRCCSGKRVLDVCTGSGCIIISLAKLAKLKEAAGCDLSEKALAVAGANAGKLGAQVRFFQSDMFSCVDGRYDIIVSNPPYIRSEDIDGLMPEVRCHEPRMALDGGEDGLSFYRLIAGQAGQFLVPDGRLYLEIGCDQAEAVSELLRQRGFRELMVVKDYAGLDRVVTGTLGPS
ncbi:MAG: peptide chain release factor N(5)-glutamine methyltransferase, partial [Lachnospiraceae bacterium]|nr:peptide chain release factor N(5)-glutamine methyltransferase [Lachnospiraceae bacterium]